MTTVADLKQLANQVRPTIEAMLDAAEELSAFRKVASEKGIDWTQFKALLKAQIQDSRDDGSRVEKLIEKADFASSYAGMLGLANMNEKHEIRSSSIPVTDGIPEFLDRRQKVSA